MSLRAPRRLVAAAAVPALLAGVAVAAPANAAPAADEPKYKGSAFALQARVALGGETLLDLMLPDVVAYPTGGDKNLIGLPAELDDVATLKVLNASAGVRDRKFAANSSTAGLNLLGNLLGARVLNSDCTADQLKLAGDSEVAGLELLGTRVPVDPGPNFRIEIPKELEALLKGSITIDEQNKLDNGGLQVRALHVNLVIAPDALGAALKSTLESVRKVAEQVVTTVESVTGQSLEQILGTTQVAKPAGGAQADRSIRSKSVATKTAKVEKAQATHKAASKAATQSKAAEQAKAAEQTRSEAVAEQAQSEAAAEQTSVSKADEAAINRHAADQAAAERAMAERAERGSKPTTDAAAAERQATEAAAARAEASTTQGNTVEAPQGTEAQAAPAAERAEEKATAKAAAAEQVRAEKTVAKKADRADLGTPDRTAVRASAPKAAPAADDDDIKGLIGLDVIVSEVNCVGARYAIKKDEPKRALPKTGGNGDMSRDIAVTGLGLLLAGSAAAFVTRRRGRHHRS
jgi:hypothetical protein